MPNAFRPSRSAIYGAPEEEAMLRINDALGSQLSRWSDEQIQAEYIRQKSAAGIAFDKERHGLNQRLYGKLANTPDAWRKHLADSKAAIFKNILDPISQPQARSDVELELNERFAAWEIDVDERAKLQRGKLSEANYSAGIKGYLTESTEFTDADDLADHLASAFEFIDTNANTGKGLPSHPSLATPAGANAVKRTIARKFIGDFLVAEVIRTGDEANLDFANAIAPADILDEGGTKALFGPEEIGELKKRVKAATDAAQTQAKESQAAAAKAREIDATVRMASGQATIPGPDGKEINIRDDILYGGHYDADTIRTLTSFYDARFGEKKTVSREQRLEAYGKIEQAIADLKSHKIDQAQAKKILYENVLAIDEGDDKKYLIKILGGEQDDAEKQSDDLQGDALNAVRPILESWRQEQRKDDTEFLQMQGDFAKRLRDAVAPRIAAGEKVDRAGLFEEAARVIQQMDDERKPKQKERGGSRIGWAFRHLSMLGLTVDAIQRARGGDEKPKQGRKVAEQPTYSRYARNPKTGERVGWDGSKWVPVP